MNFKDMPYDTQFCPINIATFSETKSEVILEPAPEPLVLPIAPDSAGEPCAPRMFAKIIGWRIFSADV